MSQPPLLVRGGETPAAVGTRTPFGVPLRIFPCTKGLKETCHDSKLHVGYPGFPFHVRCHLCSDAAAWSEEGCVDGRHHGIRLSQRLEGPALSRSVSAQVHDERDLP